MWSVDSFFPTWLLNPCYIILMSVTAILYVWKVHARDLPESFWRRSTRLLSHFTIFFLIIQCLKVCLMINKSLFWNFCPENTKLKKKWTLIFQEFYNHVDGNSDCRILDSSLPHQLCYYFSVDCRLGYLCNYAYFAVLTTQKILLSLPFDQLSR